MLQMWSPHEEYLALGDSEKRRLKAYQQLFVNKAGSEFITEIRHALNTGLALGNDRFRAEVEKLTGQPQKHMKRGPQKRLFNRQ
jgi:putative transposase